MTYTIKRKLYPMLCQCLETNVSESRDYIGYPIFVSDSCSVLSQYSETTIFPIYELHSISNIFFRSCINVRKLMLVQSRDDIGFWICLSQPYCLYITSVLFGLYQTDDFKLGPNAYSSDFSNERKPILTKFSNSLLSLL